MSLTACPVSSPASPQWCPGRPDHRQTLCQGRLASGVAAGRWCARIAVVDAALAGVVIGCEGDLRPIMAPRRARSAWLLVGCTLLPVAMVHSAGQILSRFRAKRRPRGHQARIQRRPSAPAAVCKRSRHRNFNPAAGGAQILEIARQRSGADRGQRMRKWTTDAPWAEAPLGRDAPAR